MSSSSDLAARAEPTGGRVLRGAAAGATTARRPELRTGTWTRLGSDRVLGDPATEDALDALAEAARSAAQAQGYAVGWAEGRRAAEEQAAEDAARAAARDDADRARREDEHRRVLAQLDAAAAALRDATAAVAAAVEDRALALARELTTLIVGHELRLAPDTGADAVRRALELVADLDGTVAVARLRLAPGDAGSRAARDLAERGLRVVPDPTLSPGDVVVESDEQVIDARVDAALERVRAVLR